MRIVTVAALAALMATAALAQTTDGPKIYAFSSKANFCPAGLQPVTINGTICCGTPNQTQSYQQALAHGSAKHVRASHRADCPVGTKGCTFD